MPKSQDALDGAFLRIDEALQGFDAKLSLREIGTVTTVTTGVATVVGLPGVGFEESIVFSNGMTGIAFNIDQDQLGVVLLGDYAGLNAGDECSRTGRVMDVPVGEGLLGRVLNPLGEPLDGLGPVESKARLPVEQPAASIMDRSAVSVPLQTGVKVVDALVPIGRGQRELILGDRQTGKTASPSTRS